MEASITTWTDGSSRSFTVGDDQGTAQVRADSDDTGRISTVRCDARIEPGVAPHVTVVPHSEGRRVTLMVGRFGLTVSADTAAELHEVLGQAVTEAGRLQWEEQEAAMDRRF